MLQPKLYVAPIGSATLMRGKSMTCR